MSPHPNLTLADYLSPPGKWRWGGSMGGGAGVGAWGVGLGWGGSMGVWLGWEHGGWGWGGSMGGGARVGAWGVGVGLGWQHGWWGWDGSIGVGAACGGCMAGWVHRMVALHKMDYGDLVSILGQKMFC